MPLQKPTQLPLNITLSDFATFDNFYAADNQEIVKFLRNFLTDLAAQNSILYVWGADGSGRTHLLQACCHMANQLNRSSVYLPLARIDELTPDFFEDLDGVDLICVDDIEKIANKDNWEKLIFRVVNNACLNKQKLIVTASCLPNALPIKLADLRSRLLWELIFQVCVLTDAGKIAAIQLRANNRGIIISERVATYLLSRYKRSTHELFAVLEFLDKQSLLAKRELTVNFVKEILKL